MKRFIASLICCSIVFFTATVIANAATLNFAPDSLSVEAGKTFTVDVAIDAGSDQIASSDIYINYDPSLVEVQTVTAGSFFPKTSNVSNAGRLYIYGIIENTGDFKTGTGTVATVTFRALTKANTTIKYDCDLSKSDTSKVIQNDVNATNIINCDGNGSLIVDMTAATGTTTTGTTTTGTQTVLMRSGVFDSFGTITLAGLALLTLGVVTRFIL